MTDNLLQNPEKTNTLPKTDYRELVLPHPCTRNQDGNPCQCTVCELARAKFPCESKALLSKFVFMRSAPHDVPNSSTPTVRKQCTKCHSYIGRGLKHIFTKVTKRLNQEIMVKKNSRKSKARVASNIVKHIFEERGIDKRGGTAHFETGGKPLGVTLNCKTKTRRFDLASMMKLQTVCNLSDKTVM